MEVVTHLTCKCRPGFFYKNQVSLHQHKRTKLHRTWEALQENRHDKVRSKEFENENERLKRRLAHKEEVEAELVNRIHQLEYECQYWKKQLEGVYVN
jgi:hypothetical protein